MTKAQLQEILKSNILMIATADRGDITAVEDHIETGANLILAPYLARMDDEDEAVLDALYEIASDKAFVAGQIVSTSADLTDDGAYQDYYEQVLHQATWLYDRDVSMIFMTDFSDIVTAKCALYAIREACDLPVCVGIRMREEETAIRRALSLLVSMQALGVCGVGCTNMPIDDAMDVLSEMQAFTTVPLFSLSDPGRYLEPEDYEDYIPSFVHQKCAMLGLSSGAPSFTAAASKVLWQHSPLRPDFPKLNAICSSDEVMFLDFAGKVVSENKHFLEIKTEKGEELEQALALFNKPGARPVCFEIKDIDLLEYAIMHYAGRPAVRSDEYGEITAEEYGALVLKPEKKA